MMDKQRRQNAIRHPGIIIMAAIVIPGFILSLLAVRTARHEEAFMEKQMQSAFSAELTQTVYELRQFLESIRDSLDTSVPHILVNDIKASLAGWDSLVALVDIPFVFHLNGIFISPSGDDLTPRERYFLSVNNGFFLDQQPVEIYRSIPEDYTEKILAARTAQGQNRLSARTDETVKKVAADEFEKNRNLQQEVYSDLRRRGKAVPLRTIVSGSKSETRVEAYSPRLSAYITESMHFSRIVATASSGLIPRIIDQRLILIYWKKTESDLIIGCSIDIEELTDGITAILPQLLTDVRFLTILDHNGTSAVRRNSFTPPDWKRPFVAREISRLLPRWEVAMYLIAPQSLSSRARLTALSLTLLIGILFITIAASGFILFRTIQTEIRQARQKTTFVTNVSHELKTPLTSIRIFAELLKERRQPDPAKQEKYLGIMISEIERLTRLINNVLDFARMNRGKRTYSQRICDLTSLCKQLAENQRCRLEHNHFSLETDFPGVVLHVSIDPEAIRQALLNILSNAEKYSSDDKWIRFTLKKEGSDAVIRIADHGIGIDPSLKDSIFREFYRVDDSLTAAVQGTGLGLTITRKILRDHGGDIRYQKNQPSGSEFVITLPLLSEENCEAKNTGC